MIIFPLLMAMCSPASSPETPTLLLDSGFCTFKPVAERTLRAELWGGRVVQESVSLSCIEPLTGSIGFCLSITLCINKEHFHVLTPPSPAVLRLRGLLRCLTHGQQEPSHTVGVAAVFGADEQQVAGGLLGGSMQAPADGAVIMSRLASEGRGGGGSMVAAFCAVPRRGSGRTAAKRLG